MQKRKIILTTVASSSSPPSLPVEVIANTRLSASMTPPTVEQVCEIIYSG